jgi:hypothetical protein
MVKSISMEKDAIYAILVGVLFVFTLCLASWAFATGAIIRPY